MSNIALFHGTGSAPGDFWFPWLKDQLELRNHTLWVPQLPNTEEPSLSEWLPFVLQKRNFLATQETILIGHSAGCPLILSVLEKLGAKIKKTVLVAGFAKPLNSDSPQKILQDTYDWDTIRSNAGSVITINSDNDPWGCDEKAGHYIFEKLGGTLIIRHGEGHMGSNTYNQPYREFHFLLELITSTFV